jgi:TPP-dependent pyruvate/acetoin dehydrogenase alpha subunit
MAVESRADSEKLSSADRRGLLRAMVMMRAVEERGLALYKQGRIPGSFYDGRGQEAISVGATWALGPMDAVCSPLIRDLGAHLVRGTDLTEIFRHYMGRENALSRGREGNVHFGDRRVGVVGMVSMLPDMMVVATGIAMAFKMRAEERCVISFFGDGATSRGDWHEAMNWAALYSLPTIFVLENNQFAYSTPTTKQYAQEPVARAAAYGMEAVSIDGNDVEAVFEAARLARERGLSGGGPTLIEACTLRMHGHGAHDDARYIPTALLQEWLARDPIERLAAQIGEDELAAVESEVRAEIDQAVDEAMDTPLPDPSSATEDVFCEGPPQTLGQGVASWSGFALSDPVAA